VQITLLKEKIMKKLTTPLIAAALLLNLSACSGSESERTPAASDTSAPASEVSESPPTAATSETSATPETPATSETPETPEIPEPPPAPDFNLEGVTWLVEPEHLGWTYVPWLNEWANYTLHYHSYDDVFWSWNFVIIDEQTLQPTGQYPNEGGFGGINGWLYDPQLGLLGYTSGSCSHSDIVMYPIGEFATRFPAFTDYLLIVNKVDSSVRSEPGDRGTSSEFEWLEPEAFAGEFALFFNGRFITDFERHNVSNGHDLSRIASGRFASVAAFERGGKFGVMSSRGEILVPFALDEIQIIDDRTAFARVGGYHGILTWS
jgi:hypothetical protein